MIWSLPSWRWVVLFVVLAVLVSAALLLYTKPKDRTNEFTKSYMDVVIAVIAVAACVCALAWQYALLPRVHSTICDRKGTEGVKHHLAYITGPEMDTLIADGGWGHTKPGMSGTQGVKCFPQIPTEEDWWPEVRMRARREVRREALEARNREVAHNLELARAYFNEQQRLMAIREAAAAEEARLEQQRNEGGENGLGWVDWGEGEGDWGE
jgi:hypothetical protein